MIKTFPKDCKVRIVPLYGKTTVAQWYASQKQKPLAALNGSLYSYEGGKMIPAGIVFEKGKHINGAGNALGLGYRSPEAAWEFARAYDAVWEQFLSGYVLVRDACVEPVPTVFYGDDRNLHLNKHVRLAVGQMAGGGFAILGSDSSCILSDFKKYCASQGVVNAINVDGGGSRHFICYDQVIYTSTRTPYNIIAIYPPDHVDEIKEEETTLKALCAKKTSVLDITGATEKGRYIDKGDVCEIDGRITPSLLIEVAYPTSAGMRLAYVKSLEGFRPL